MKDCKWNPTTAGSKGQLFDASGRPVERGMLDAVTDGDRLLKLLDDVADRKARRAAANQVKQWRKDGTYAKFLSGELDPPPGWTLHIRDAAADLGGPSHAVDATLKALVSMPNWANRPLPANETPEMLSVLARSRQQLLSTLPAKRAALAPHLVSLERQGRITPTDLQRFATYLGAWHGNPERATSAVERLSAALGSPTTALELVVRHADVAGLLTPTDELFKKKVSLLRHTSVLLEDGVASSYAVLQYAASTGMSAARFDMFARRSHDVATASGLDPSEISQVLFLDAPRQAGSSDEPSPLLLLSVLADPVDQRALAVVLATVKHSGWGAAALAGTDPVALLAAEAHNLPAGAGDLDRLVRAVAAGLRDGRIHGDPTTAARTALAYLTDAPARRAAPVVTADEWSHGTLGVLDTGEFAYPYDLSLDRALERTRSHAWDTILIPAGATAQDHLLAAALSHERTSASRLPDGFASRADALANMDTKLRSLAQAAALDGARSATPSAGVLAAALLADATAGRAAAAATAPLLGEYLASCTLDADATLELAPTARILTRVAADAALQHWPAAPVFADPHTEAAYRRARAASADTLASPAEPFLDPRDAGAVLTVAHAASSDAVALALRVEDALAAAGIQASCKPRTGELAVTLDPDTDQDRALETLFELFAPAS